MRLGQALVVVLLVLAVALTTSLAIVSRSITDVGVSTTEEESARALSSAEAGIEAALAGTVAVGGTGTVGTAQTGGSYQINAITATASKGINYDSIKSGESVTFFLAPYNPDGTPVSLPAASAFNGPLDICWGDTDLSKTAIPALELSLYFYSTAYQVHRLAYDPDPTRGTGFDAGILAPPGDCPTTRTYKYRVRIEDIQATFIPGQYPLFLRIRMWNNPYEAHYLSIGSDIDFPAQGVAITSTGTAGDTARTVQVFQSYPDQFSLFDIGLYSGGTLQQQ